MDSKLTIAASGAGGAFRLAEKQSVAPLYIDAADFPVVRIAAQALSSDIAQITGTAPAVELGMPARSDYAVFIGTLGKNAVIDKLVAEKKIDQDRIRGAWESFVIATVPHPAPGVAMGLVIAGSDRRGTAYGVFTLSEAIGVSPWNWWADVPPKRRDALFVRPVIHRQKTPTVKYRGIFINDEDWGLQPWAAKTFEPETGDIGPKTYAKVCELLLRLKANYLWPAMHDCTKAFNLYPQNKIVADTYAIVMGSSHAEPMLRNNVSEWPHDQAKQWNPVTNLPGVLDYWEQRVRENGTFENTWTVGMRGIHDGSMPGGGTIPEKRDRLEKIIGLQRAMLARYVNPDASRIPQIFCPYKEVLDIYQSGLTLPDDITIVWTDDNFGYIRQLPSTQERKRTGGHGIYYHLSYWGRPHDYLWLDSTAPALLWNEMTRAYKMGVRQLWVVNVGDIKSIETGMTLFLKLAWDIDQYGLDVQHQFLRDFYTQQFGSEHAETITRLKDEYYRLCAIRRPEHMGFNRVYPNTPVQNSYWSHTRENDEAGQLLQRWLDLAHRTEEFAGKLLQESRDAYFQLVEYPACAAAAMAQKIIQAEKARLTGSQDQARQAEAAFQRIAQLTERYNSLKNGKWRGMMDHRPRRLPVFAMPPMTRQETPGEATPASSEPVIEIDPIKFIGASNHDGAGWRVVEGLGPRGCAIAVLPPKDGPTLLEPEKIREHAPFVEYAVTTPPAGSVEVIVEALPTHRLTPAHAVVVAVSFDEEEPVLVRFDQGRDEENDPIWQTNVLRNAMFGRVTIPVREGKHQLKLWATDPSVVVQRIRLVPRGTTQV